MTVFLPHNLPHDLAADQWRKPKRDMWQPPKSPLCQNPPPQPVWNDVGRAAIASHMLGARPGRGEG